MKLIIDGFGGDNSPDEILKGVYDSFEKTDADFIICGNETILKERMTALSLPESDRVSILHAETKIEGNV